MKTIDRRLLAVAAVIVVVILGWLVLFGRTGGQLIGTPAGANGLSWREGSAQTYDVTLDSSFMMSLPGAGAGQSISVSLEAVMQFTTLRVEPGQVVAGIRLSPVTMYVNAVTDKDVNQDLARPFRVLFRPDGQPMAFEFPAEIAAEHRQVLENLVRMFQVTVRAGNDWLVKESNASGVYEARYRRSAADTLVKEKLRYLSASPATAATVPEVKSSESIQLGVNTDWIVAMNLDETITVNDSGAPPVEIRNLASISLRRGQIAGTLDQWRFTATAEPAVSAEAQQTAVPDISREEALQQIEVGVSKLDAAVEGRSILIHRLRDLVMVDDTLPGALLETMNSEALADRTRADLYLALELAGTAAAQTALASVTVDSSWSPLDGMRAIVALGGVRTPTPDTLSALWDIAQSGADYGDRKDLPSTAALALGSIGRTLLETEDGGYAALRVGLQAGAASAGSPHQQSAYLHALGNTGDPDPALRSDITRFLDDPAAEVRSAAAQTLGRLGPELVAEELLESFKQERNSVVRSSIAGALAAWEQPSPEAMSLARTVVRDDPDERTRYNMAVLLGKNLGEHPQNRAVLEQVLATEQSKRIRQQVADTLY